MRTSKLLGLLVRLSSKKNAGVLPLHNTNKTNSTRGYGETECDRKLKLSSFTVPEVVTVVGFVIVIPKPFCRNRIAVQTKSKVYVWRNIEVPKYRSTEVPKYRRTEEPKFDTGKYRKPQNIGIELSKYRDTCRYRVSNPALAAGVSTIKSG